MLQHRHYHHHCHALSLAGAATSIIFVATKFLRLSQQNTSSVATKVLSRQNYVCRDKHTFVATKDVFCCDNHVFVARQKGYLCQFPPVIMNSSNSIPSKQHQRQQRIKMFCDAGAAGVATLCASSVTVMTSWLLGLWLLHFTPVAGP